jgi:hypothetical protein
MARFDRARAFFGLIQHNGEDIPPNQQIPYVCSWLDKIAKNKRFMVRSLHVLKDGPATSYPMFDALCGVYGVGGVLYLDQGRSHFGVGKRSYTDCKNYLARYKSAGANFAVIHLRDGWHRGHSHRVFALKLDQSYTGGWLNSSYPCAMFDPHIGQGMYSNHTDLAFDLCTLLQHYGHLGFYRGESYLLQASGID